MHLVFTVHLDGYVCMICYTCCSLLFYKLPSCHLIISDESISVSLDEIIANKESDDEFISDFFGNYYYYYCY